jgi:hypothetical protein
MRMHGHEWIFEDDENEHDLNVSGNDNEDFSDIFHGSNEQFMDSEHV